MTDCLRSHRLGALFALSLLTACAGPGPWVSKTESPPANAAPATVAAPSPAPAAPRVAPPTTQPDAVIKLQPGSTRLAPDMSARLARIAEAARADENIMLRLEGYVPGGGSPSVNLLRAEESAQIVRQRLMEMAINPRRILLAPFGGEYDKERDERLNWVDIYLIHSQR